MGNLPIILVVIVAVIASVVRTLMEAGGKGSPSEESLDARLEEAIQQAKAEAARRRAASGAPPPRVEPIPIPGQPRTTSSPGTFRTQFPPPPVIPAPRPAPRPAHGRIVVPPPPPRRMEPPPPPPAPRPVLRPAAPGPSLQPEPKFSYDIAIPASAQASVGRQAAADPVSRVKQAQAVVSEDGIRADAATSLGGALRMTPRELRRLVIAREMLGPPRAVRGWRPRLGSDF